MNPEYQNNHADQIMGSALDTIAALYGTGDTVIDQLNPPEARKPYHNVMHTQRVIEAARLLAMTTRLDLGDVELVRLIASAHDIFHGGTSDTETDEELSAAWLAEQMNKAGFSRDEVEITRLAILGTTTELVDGSILQQQARTIQYPSKRARIIAHIVACADLEPILAPHGPLAAHRLFEEHSDALTPDSLLPPTLLAFEESQIEIVRRYKPIMPEAETTLPNVRNERITYHENLINDIEAGIITTWGEIIARDKEFMHVHGYNEAFPIS